MRKRNIKKLTVNIAVAAFNAEKNIARLISSILCQEVIDYKLSKIIINSDCSSDNTVKIARTFNHPKLKITDSKERQGFAKALIKLFTTNDADVLIILNDDIIIKDNFFINNLMKKFYISDKVGLVCANIQPLKPINFVTKAATSGFSVYKRMGEFIRNGENAITCDGKVLCLSNAFIKSNIIPLNHKDMGNVDRFLYFLCIKNGFKYKYSAKAITYFKFPSTLKDFVKWQIRNYKNNIKLSSSSFKELAKKELNYPYFLFNYFKFLEFFKHPLHSIFILLVGFYCSIMAKFDNKDFNIKWEVIQSTKEI